MYAGYYMENNFILETIFYLKENCWNQESEFF